MGEFINEFIRDLDLPSVVDTDPEVVEQLAEHAVQVVGFALPAVGIIHDYEVDKGKLYMSSAEQQRDIHDAHRALIEQAVRLAGPIIYADGFEDEPQVRDYKMGIGLHADKIGKKIVPRKGGDNSAMKLRLHTGSAPAKVTVANSEPGVFSGIGDEDLYSSPDSTSKALAHGYDVERRRLTVPKALALIELGGTDPIMAAPEVYHFYQGTHSSVLFRSASSFGSITLHGFRGILPGERFGDTSDMNVRSHLLLQ